MVNGEGDRLKPVLQWAQALCRTGFSVSLPARESPPPTLPSSAPIARNRACRADRRGRVDSLEKRRILLRAGGVAVVADRFDADHDHHALAALAATFRVDPASHLLGGEVRRLLVGEGDEAQGA